MDDSNISREPCYDLTKHTFSTVHVKRTLPRALSVCTPLARRLSVCLGLGLRYGLRHGSMKRQVCVNSHFISPNRRKPAYQGHRVFSSCLIETKKRSGEGGSIQSSMLIDPLADSGDQPTCCSWTTLAPCPACVFGIDIRRRQTAMQVVSGAIWPPTSNINIFAITIVQTV